MRLETSEIVYVVERMEEEDITKVFLELFLSYIKSHGVATAQELFDTLPELVNIRLKAENMIKKLIDKSFLNEEQELSNNLDKVVIKERIIEKPCNLVHFDENARL